MSKNNVIDLTGINHPLLLPEYIRATLISPHELLLEIKQPFACKTVHTSIQRYLADYLKNKGFLQAITFKFQTEIIPHKVKVGLTRLANIKNIIAVTSGKGGVGKSTTAINLALALKNNGAKVGILDADIYGPSLPTLVGEKSFKPDVDDAKFVPLNKFGLQILSFGFLIDEKQPAIWRGAIVNKALDQLLFDTKWGELDYLVIDMPPGTGDIHLTMCQKLPITATIVITTPQDLALVDVTKSIAMYHKLDIPCLGVVENMSMHTCSKCGHTEAIFGQNGAKRLLEEHGLATLASLPLDINICDASDRGVPIMSLPQITQVSEAYNQMAINVSQALAKLPKDYSAKIGKVAKM